jgi:hypothetical protein
VSTRGIAGTGSGMLRCAKNQNCTRNCGTRFKSTAGLPVPVLNPNHIDESGFPRSDLMLLKMGLVTPSNPHDLDSSELDVQYGTRIVHFYPNLGGEALPNWQIPYLFLPPSPVSVSPDMCVSDNQGLIVDIQQVGPDSVFLLSRCLLPVLLFLSLPLLVSLPTSASRVSMRMRVLFLVLVITLLLMIPPPLIISQ